MKAYVQIKNKLPINTDIQCAIDGLEYLNYDIKTFTFEEILAGNYDRIALNSPFIGSIDGITNLFKRIGKYPEPIDFPESIINSGLLNREIKKCVLSECIEKFKNDNKPFFVKPVETKLFDGALISNINNLSYLRGFENKNVIVCDKIDIVSEHRAYIHNGKMIYCCNYDGDFRINPDYNYIDLLIGKYENSPIAYTIDVAILKDGSMTVVEFNDMWAIGSYGLKPWDYAHMLVDRYFEIVK